MAHSLVDNVLIVVDFQNGFIKGGSFGGHDPKLTALASSVEQALQIEKLIDTNNTIIFTRDFHPINHLSLAVPGKVTENHVSTWHTHCLNVLSTPCPRHNSITNGLKMNNNTNYGLNQSEINKLKGRTLNSFITVQQYLEKYQKVINTSLYSKLKFDANALNQPIIGTNISFLMYLTKYAPQILALITANEPIGLVTASSKNTGPGNMTVNDPFILTSPSNVNKRIKNSDGRTFVQLTKGQLCRYESYSAFNYHWHIKLRRTLNKSTPEKGKLLYNLNGNPIKNPNGTHATNNGLAQYESEYITKNYSDNNELYKLSTGLFEYILRTDKKNINITVCGLVGEVCVINSVVEGLIMWKKHYQSLDPSKKVVFNYSLAGTLFTGYGINHFEASLQPENMNAFYDNMIAYLNDTNLVPFFKELIEFNILDKDGNFCQSIRYNNGELFNSPDQIKFNGNAKRNGNGI
jgi:hypothetical protein